MLPSAFGGRNMTDLKIGVVDVFVLDAAQPMRVLLLRRGEGTRCTGAWEVVHGRIEGEERPEDAAVREVREETGLKVQRLYSVTCQPFYLHRLGTVQLSVVFAAYVDAAFPTRLSVEHDLAEWVAAAAAVERLTWPRSRQVLRDIQGLLADGNAGPVEDVLRVR